MQRHLFIQLVLEEEIQQNAVDENAETLEHHEEDIPSRDITFQEA